MLDGRKKYRGTSFIHVKIDRTRYGVKKKGKQEENENHESGDFAPATINQLSAKESVKRVTSDLKNSQILSKFKLGGH